MTLLRPELLWLALAGVPVVILHLIRRRRKRHRIPSLMLWERVVGHAPRRMALRVLTAILSLLLLLAAVGAVSMSAAGPVRGEPAPPPRPLLIAIGASARMEGERWDRALAIAAGEIAKKATYDPVTLLLVSEEPRILVTREVDPEALASALAGARPSLSDAAWPLARDALADGVERGRAVAIGVNPAAPEGVVIQPVGGANSGITGFRAAILGDEVELFLKTTGAVSGAEIVVRRGDEEIARIPAPAEETLTVDRGEGGVFTVRLEPATGPTFDDQVSACIAPPRRLSLGLVTEKGLGPDPFLKSALAVVAHLLDEKSSGTFPPERLARAAAELDVIVITGPDLPETLPDGDYILLTPPPEMLGFVPVAAVPSAPIWERADDHPVTASIDAAEIQVMGAIAARVPEGATALLSVPDGAVAAVGTREGIRYVWIGLGPGTSTLPVTAAYPLMVRNSLEWFASLSESPFPPAVVIGERLEPIIRLAPGVSAVKAVAPGVTDVLEVLRGAFAYVPEAREEGVVRLTIGPDEFAVALNAILPRESAASPREGDPMPAPDRTDLADTEERLWSLFAAAAAAALLLEWILSRLLPGK